jgi:hypothetical protein
MLQARARPLSANWSNQGWYVVGWVLNDKRVESSLMLVRSINNMSCFVLALAIVTPSVAAPPGRPPAPDLEGTYLINIARFDGDELWPDPHMLVIDSKKSRFLILDRHEWCLLRGTFTQAAQNHGLKKIDLVVADQPVALRPFKRVGEKSEGLFEALTPNTTCVYLAPPGCKRPQNARVDGFAQGSGVLFLMLWRPPPK